MPDASLGRVTLGWQVTPNLDPKYWLDPAAKAGHQSDSDLVQVPTRLLANHTAVIAQSGSGKSFFLGRLIEEILLETQARCVIIDPNSDFRKMYEIRNASFWRNAKYETATRNGILPHESSREEFAARWSAVSLRIRTGSTRQFRHSERLRLWWPSISVEFLAEELDPMLRSDLYHIHAFVRALEPLVLLKRGGRDPIDLIEEAERLFRQGRQRSEEDFRKDLEREFNVRELQTSFRQIPKMESIRGNLAYTLPFRFMLPFWYSRLFDPKNIAIRINGLLKAPKYVSDVVERFYFGKAREYQGAGILETQPQPGKLMSSLRPGSRRLGSGFKRLEIVDLPSLPDGNTRLLAANTIIGDEWERARAIWSSALELPPDQDARVPTFVVVDEAHNLIPANPRGKAEAALRELFRTIVAEGRKYGLFLIVVSQQPDKLDPLVISQCENKVVMKLGSISILNISKPLKRLKYAPSRLLRNAWNLKRGAQF